MKFSVFGKWSSKEAFEVLIFLEKEAWKKEIKKEGNKDFDFSNWKKLFYHSRSFSLRLFKEGFEKKEGRKKEIKLPPWKQITTSDYVQKT